MRRQNRNPSPWLLSVTFCLVTLALFMYTTPSLYAQGVGAQVVGAQDVEAQVAPVIESDDAAFLWQNDTLPFVPKPGSEVAASEDVKEIKQFDHSLFLPNMYSEPKVGAAAVHASWRLIHLQNFEGNFPTPGWTVTDYNGPLIGVPATNATVVWDDNSTRAYNSYWSAHPNDSKTYVNNTDTWMRYGPFSLVGATDARYSFRYWLSSEASYDFFSWEASCGGTATFGLGFTQSGEFNAWGFQQVKLTQCVGRDQVYIRFGFRSDYSGTKQGVWVDDIKIEKYQ